MSLNMDISRSFFTSQKLERLNGVKHFFSTKIEGDYSSVLSDINNRSSNGALSKVITRAGFHINHIVYLKQVHGNKYHFVDDKNMKELTGVEGDAIITKTSNIAIGVFTADCVPILLFDKELRIAAAIHAGWRGTNLKITHRVASYMMEELGSAPQNIYAAIGPSIGSCCFEVGEEVFSKFNFTSKEGNKLFVDLNKENASQLMELGIGYQNIEDENFCTMHNKELFHSYRREQGHAGRQASFIQLFEEDK